MADAESDEGGGVETVNLVSKSILQADGSFDSNYDVGLFQFENPETGDLAEVPVIVVAKVDGSFLVAVPGSKWHRTIARRALPPQSLTRVLQVTVAAASEAERDSPAAGISIPLWLGFLKKEFEACLSFSEPVPEDAFPTDKGEKGFLPLAEGLCLLADERYSFLSAQSEAGEGGLNQRLAKLEEGFILMQQSLSQIAKGVQKGPDDPVSALRRVAKPKVVPGKKEERGDYQDLDAGIAGLDGGVVAAALQAGIDRQHLEELGRLMGAQTGRKLQDLPKRGPSKLDRLGESAGEEEFQPLPGARDVVLSNEEPSDPMTAALVKLTSIVDALSNRRKPRNLEELLEDQGGYLESASSSTLMGGGRRHATVMKALRRTLLESPQEIYGCIEKRMLDDFGSREQAPGEPDRVGTWRGWLEHRSRIPNIGNSVRMIWSVGGALDCLKKGRVEEAKARLALLVGQVDQVAIDRGQWLLAQEGSLEEQPPFSAFQRHTVPEAYESQHTKLWDPRWAEAMMQKVRDLDDFQERRAKLGKKAARAATPPKGGDDKTGKGRKGEKGGGKKASGSEESSQA